MKLLIYQVKELWPDEKAKDTIFTKCFICHGFQLRYGIGAADADGWADRVQFMRDAMHFSLSRPDYGSGRFRSSDLSAQAVRRRFGLPEISTEMPAYKAKLKPFPDEAMNIAYVEYEMPGPSRMPFSAAPAKDGSVWIPNFGIGQ